MLWLSNDNNLTNRMWFSVVCTLIDNDIRHRGGQNVVDSRGADCEIRNNCGKINNQPLERCKIVTVSY